MFDWLFDNAVVILVSLGSAGIACAVAWWRTDTGRKYYAIGFGIVAVLFLTYIVLSLFYETAKEQMARRVQDMANSVKSKQVRPVLEKNLSDDFHVGTYGKSAFIEHAQRLADQFQVDSVEVWKFELVEIDKDKRTATISFKAKPHTVPTDNTAFYIVRAVFVMTPKEKWWLKEEWKMRSFEYFNPFVESNQPLPVP